MPARKIRLDEDPAAQRTIPVPDLVAAVKNATPPMLAQLLEKALGLKQITSDREDQQAADMIRELSDAWDQVENGRTGITKPINDLLKVVNAAFKPTLTKVDEAKQRLRNLMTGYAREKRLAAEELAAKQRTEQKALGLKQTAFAAEPLRPAGATTRKDWKFEVTDLEKIPLDFLLVNEKMVLEALRAGETIPGIKGWQEETTVVRR